MGKYVGILGFAEVSQLLFAEHKRNAGTHKVPAKP